MKRIILICTMLCTLFCLNSCAGTGDWTYVLPNGYEMWHINSSEILIKYAPSENEVKGIPSFIKEFAVDERYVFTRNVEDISQNSILDEIYYILDTKEQKIYGPFETAEEMQNQANELQCIIPQKWYRTSPDPNMTK